MVDPESGDRANAKSSRRAKVIAVLISTAVSLVVLEIVLRTFFPFYQTSILEAYQYDEELGYRLRPGIHMFEVTDFQEEVRVNNFGTVNFQENFDNYETLVMAVGDSFTQGTGLPSDMSYPAQLDMILNKSADGFYQPKYGVMNLGLAAFGGEQSVLAAKRWASITRPPKYVLYLGSGNDHQDDVLFASGYRHNHIVNGSPKWGILVRPLQWLTNDLQIGIRAKLLIGELRRSRMMQDEAGTGDAGPKTSVAELERPAIEKLAAFATENDAKLIVGWAGHDDSYEWLKKWAADNSVAFADWYPKVSSVTAAIPQIPKENQHSGGHYRGWVNRVIAEEYGRQILGD